MATKQSNKSSKNIKASAAKADMDLIQAKSAECLFHALTGEKPAHPVELGPNELAWQAKQREQHEKELRKARRGKHPEYSVGIVVLDPAAPDCGVGSLESHIEPTRDGAVSYIVDSIADIAGVPVKLNSKGAFHRNGKKAVIDIDFPNGVGKGITTGDMLVAIVKADGLITMYSLDETWIPNRRAK